MSKPVRFAALGCIHAPLHDQKALDWAMREIREYKPDVIVELGDLIESCAASKWDDALEMNIHLGAEFASATEIQKRIRMENPRAQLVKLEGNHEANLLEIGRIDPRVRSLCNWRDPKNMPEIARWKIPSRYTYCRNRGAYRIGQVVFAHGYECGVSSDEQQALYFANEYGLFVSAHTHRPTPYIMQAHKTKSLPLRYWYANVGCLRDMSPHFMERKRKMAWGQAVILGEARDTKSPRHSRMWNAEMRVFRMYDEYAVAA